MQFSDTTNYTGIIQEIERLTDLGIGAISGTTAVLKNFTAMCNNANRDILTLIFESTGNWQYDDSNYADLPEATANLVSGTSKYALPTEALTVQRIEILDSASNWITLTPFIKENIADGIDEFMETDSTPTYYRVFGGTIELYPAPNYNSTGGLKVYYDRDSVDFDTSDTSQTPGFASQFHKLLPLKVAIEWLMTKQPTFGALSGYMNREQKMEALIKSFYSKRWKDYKPRIGRLTQRFT